MPADCDHIRVVPARTVTPQWTGPGRAGSGPCWCQNAPRPVPGGRRQPARSHIHRHSGTNTPRAPNDGSIVAAARLPRPGSYTQPAHRTAGRLQLPSGGVWPWRWAVGDGRRECQRDLPVTTLASVAVIAGRYEAARRSSGRRPGTSGRARRPGSDSGSGGRRAAQNRWRPPSAARRAQASQAPRPLPSLTGARPPAAEAGTFTETARGRPTIWNWGQSLRAQVNEPPLRNPLRPQRGAKETVLSVHEICMGVSP